MEKRLQTINPAFAFPYWSSGRDAANPLSAPQWNFIGTNGSPVQGDVFGGKALLDTLNGGTKPLERDYTTMQGLPTNSLWTGIYQQTLTTGGFAPFAQLMETNHGTLHVIVGGANGQMTTYCSPTDPVFYMYAWATQSPNTFTGTTDIWT